MTHMFDHNGLLKQLAQGSNYSVSEEKKPNVEQPTYDVLTHVSGSPCLLELGIDAVHEFTEILECVEFMDLPHEVVWDEEMSSNIIMHSGLLQQLAFGSKSTTTTQPNQCDINTHKGVLEQLAFGEEYLDVGIMIPVDDHTISVANDSSLFLEHNVANTDKMSNEIPNEVVWDEECLYSLDSCGNYLQQYWVGKDNKQMSEATMDDELTHDRDTPFLLVLGMDLVDEMLGSLVMDGDSSSAPEMRALLLQQLAWGKETLGSETGQHVTKPVLEDLAAVSSSTVDTHSDLQLSNQVCKSELFVNDYPMDNKYKQETIDDCTALTEMMPCQEEDTQQLVEEIMSGVVVVSEGPAHVLFDTTYLEHAVFRTPGLFDGDAAEVFVVFGPVVWDKMPAAIDTHHGLLQYSTQRENYFGDDKKVESVDHVTSQGASHVMFLAMSCTYMVWNDALLNGHEYQEQVVSTTAAMSRIWVDLDKQKTYGMLFNSFILAGKYLHSTGSDL